MQKQNFNTHLRGGKTYIDKNLKGLKNAVTSYSAGVSYNFSNRMSAFIEGIHIKGAKYAKSKNKIVAGVSFRFGGDKANIALSSAGVSASYGMANTPNNYFHDTIGQTMKSSRDVAKADRQKAIATLQPSVEMLRGEIKNISDEIAGYNKTLKDFNNANKVVPDLAQYSKRVAYLEQQLVQKTTQFNSANAKLTRYGAGLSLPGITAFDYTALQKANDIKAAADKAAAEAVRGGGNGGGGVTPPPPPPPGPGG